MAYNFFGVYFEGADGTEYRCGFRNQRECQPKLYVRQANAWVEVRGRGIRSAQSVSAALRAQLPTTIAFPPDAHTQNQRLELINQIVYNLSRKTAQGNNYGGAHAQYMSNKTAKKKGLSNEELIAKYDTGKKVNFDKALRLMCKTPSGFSLAKPSKSKR